MHDVVERLGFEFRLNPEEKFDPTAEVPTTVSRSGLRLDSEHLAGLLSGNPLDDDDLDTEAVAAGLEDALLRRVVDAFAAHRAGRKLKHASAAAAAMGAASASSSVADRQSAAAAAAAAEVGSKRVWAGTEVATNNGVGDDDIFADAGTYDAAAAVIASLPPLEKRHRWDNTSSSGGGGTNISASGTVPPMAPPPPPPLPLRATVGAAIGSGVAGFDYFQGLRATKTKEEAEASAAEVEEGAVGGGVSTGAVVAGIKGMAAAVSRMEARRTGTTEGTAEKGAVDSKGGQAMAGSGEDYGQTYDYDFSGEGN